jgi:hypothetical protein
MRATVALLLILGLVGPAMANDTRSAPVTNFGMRLQLSQPQQPIPPEESAALLIKMLKGELSPEEMAVYQERLRNSPQQDFEPVPHRFGEEEFADELRKQGRTPRLQTPLR